MLSELQFILETVSSGRVWFMLADDRQSSKNRYSTTHRDAIILLRGIFEL